VESGESGVSTSVTVEWELLSGSLAPAAADTHPTG
jgi:hypothetical protein